MELVEQPVEHRERHDNLQHVSSLMDGELAREELPRAIGRIKVDDAAGREAWDTYHLIGDVLRDGAAAQYGINTLAPFYQDELGLSRAQVGLFFSAFYSAMSGASFGAGWLADRTFAKNRSFTRLKISSAFASSQVS